MKIDNFDIFENDVRLGVDGDPSETIQSSMSPKEWASLVARRLLTGKPVFEKPSLNGIGEALNDGVTYSFSTNFYCSAPRNNTVIVGIKG